MNDYMNAMLASFWEDLKTGSGGPTMIVLMIVAAAAIVLLPVCLVLLARRSTVILDEGEGKKQVIKCEVGKGRCGKRCEGRPFGQCDNGRFGTTKRTGTRGRCLGGRNRRAGRGEPRNSAFRG